MTPADQLPRIAAIRMSDGDRSGSMLACRGGVAAVVHRWDGTHGVNSVGWRAKRAKALLTGSRMTSCTREMVAL